MSKTKELILGSMCAALVAILVLLNVVIAGYLLLLIPLPLMYYGKISSFRNVLVTYCVSILLVFMLSGIGYAVLVFGYGAVAVAYTFLRNKKYSKRMILVGTSVVNALNLIIMIVFFSNIVGVDIGVEMNAIKSFLGIQSDMLVSSLLLTFYGVLILCETWVIIYAFEVFEVLLNRIDK